jgi:putative FmdB family regulatory protein
MCRNCGRTIEVIHSMLEDGPSVCEQCGGAMRRVLHPTGIIFKGSGFYKTDSRSSSSASVGGSPSSAKKPTESGGGATPGGGGASPKADSPPKASPGTD